MTILLIMIAALVVYRDRAYNSLVSCANQVDNAWRQIDVQLKRRHDLIPNLVEAVKGYMQFERDTLTQVVEARAKAVSAPDQAARIAAENQLTPGIGKLLAVMENYPQLKADQSVMQLQEELTTTENQIAFSRQAYNDVVLTLNTRVEIPLQHDRDQFGFHAAEYFKGAPEDQAVPKVDLGADARAPDAAMPAAIGFSRAGTHQSPRDRRPGDRVHAAFLLLGCGVRFLRRHVAIINGHLSGAPVFMLLALIFASVQALISYFGGAPLMLLRCTRSRSSPDTTEASDGARRDQRDGARVAAAGAEGYLIPDPSPNAFATGRDPEHSVICVTQGLIDKMDREELQGVIGHEMSHIADYDIRTMMMVAVLVGGIAMLSRFHGASEFLSRQRAAIPIASGGGAHLSLLIFVLAVVAPILSQLIAMAVSREREYLADASSVEFTRNPRALLRALAANRGDRIAAEGRRRAAPRICSSSIRSRPMPTMMADFSPICSRRILR